MFEIILGIGVIGAIGSGGQWLYKKYAHESTEEKTMLQLTYYQETPVTVQETIVDRFYNAISIIIYGRTTLFDEILLEPEAQDIGAEDLEAVSNSVHIQWPE